MSVAFALLALAPPALFEDQAGKFDWARENVGSVGAAVFRSVGSQRLAVVASEAAVAGIDLRTGGTAWRRTMRRACDSGARDADGGACGGGARGSWTRRGPGSWTC